LIHQTPASGNRRLGRVNAREGAEETLRTMLAGLGDHIDAKRSGKARALSLDGKEQHLRPSSRANRCMSDDGRYTSREAAESTRGTLSRCTIRKNERPPQWNWSHGAAS
jgi:hypothetical protein